MKDEDKKMLLNDKRVIEEINRHRWIESEKAGHDIGFDRASSDWLDRFSNAWMEYHMPKRKAPSSYCLSPKPPARKKIQAGKK
jgi:hypothetical protein